MTKFLIGLLLGLILGIGGASAFLITAGGGDYLVGTSPRVRELEASLREAQQERQWLRGRLSEASELSNRLESRFLALAAKFEALANDTGHPTALPGLEDSLPAANVAPSPPQSPPPTTMAPKPSTPTVTPGEPRAAEKSS